MLKKQNNNLLNQNSDFHIFILTKISEHTANPSPGNQEPINGESWQSELPVETKSLHDYQWRLRPDEAPSMPHLGSNNSYDFFEMDDQIDIWSSMQTKCIHHHSSGLSRNLWNIFNKSDMVNVGDGSCEVMTGHTSSFRRILVTSINFYSPCRLRMLFW